MDAEPVGDTQDRAQIAGVTDAVEGQDEFVGTDAGRYRIRLPHDGEGGRRMGQLADAGHGFFADVFDAIVRNDVEAGQQSLGNELFTLYDEQTPLIAKLLLSQRFDFFYFVFGKHKQSLAPLRGLTHQRFRYISS